MELFPEGTRILAAGYIPTRTTWETTMKPQEWLTLFLGEIKYRPPAGKPEDRMLALATGRTESGEKIGTKSPDLSDADRG